MKRQICIIGCGWLGFPLAKSLVEKGAFVKGSTTSNEKLGVLKSHGIDPFLLKLSSEGITGDLNQGLAHCETLVLNIPPGLRKDPDQDYVSRMQQIVPYLEASSIQNMVFVSSTSVYDDDFPFPEITEDTPTSTTSKSAQQLIAVENLFRENTNFNTTIIRFSGLFGKDRHPAKFLSGRSNLKNGNAPVNLIHLSDCISIIETLIEQDCWNITFNASTTPHPSKKDYYTSVCESLGIPLPHFDSTSISEGKIINASKLARVLGYGFEVKLQ